MATRKPSNIPAPSTARRARVWYEDGASSPIINPSKPALLTVFEAEWGHETPDGVTETMWHLWHALGRPGGSDGFDVWFGTVEDVEWIEMELGKAYK